MSVAALILDRGARARLADALKGREKVHDCGRVAELLGLVRSTPSITDVVTELWDLDGRPVADGIATLRQEYPSVPVTAYVSLSRGAAAEVLRISRAGANALILRGVDDSEFALQSILRRARDDTTATTVIDALIALVPPALHGVFTHCVKWGATGSLTVCGLAAAHGVHRKTLARRLALSGLPGPHALISWGRLVYVGRLLEDPGRAVEHIALALDFVSAPAMRAMLRRYAGLRPQQVREGGGLACVLRLFKNALRIGTQRCASNGGVGSDCLRPSNLRGDISCPDGFRGPTPQPPARPECREVPPFVLGVTHVVVAAAGPV